jgi:hypothetical protein
MFSSLTQPHYPTAALGIEKDNISAVALQGSRRNLSIKQAATVEVAPGILEPGFIDVNILDQSGFIAALRELVEVAGLLKQKRWSVALPSNTARSAILALESEPASRAEVDEILDWKAEQSFGVPARELRLSKEKISPDKEGRTRFFTTAVKLAIIDEYESLFEGLNWRAGLILPRAVGEANWLMNGPEDSDSLLISASNDGFTALLLRGAEPAVVRSVTCTPEEVDDEIYRLVMFYNDRFSASSGSLDNLLVVGSEFIPSRIQTIASEALGRDLKVLDPQDVGLSLPSGALNFDEIAAPAGLAALGFG